MFILQDGKLYIQEKDKIIGVSIYSDKILPVKGTETKLGKHSKLTALEVRCRFNIKQDSPYIFPFENKVEIEDKKDVKPSESTSKTKSTTRKSTGK